MHEGRVQERLKELLNGADPRAVTDGRSNYETALLRLKSNDPELFGAHLDTCREVQLSTRPDGSPFTPWDLVVQQALTPYDENAAFNERREYERATRWDDGSRAGFAPTKQSGPYKDPWNKDLNSYENSGGWK